MSDIQAKAQDAVRTNVRTDTRTDTRTGVHTGAQAGAQGSPSDTSPQVFDFRKPSALNATSDKQPAWQLARPVFFVGFMGAGKTSVARKVARIAQATSIDLDRYIERHCEMSIKKMFATSGEEGFRAVETEVLRELAQGEPRLIACGGGVVLAQENRNILTSSGFVVYLQVTADEAASRISNVRTRPLFRDLENARRVIEQRLPLYEEVADVRLNTTGRSTKSLAYEVADILKDEGVLQRDLKREGM